jgi:hypothetical protein
MDDNSLDEITVRLRQLERECKRLGSGTRLWRWIGCAALCGMVVLIVGGAHFGAAPKTIEAEQFVLRDEKGKMRADLGFMPDGMPALSLYDGDGKTLLSANVRPDGKPSLYLTDKDKNVLHLGVLSDGNPNIWFMDGKGQPRAILGLAKGGDPMLHLADSNGKPRVSISVDDGVPAFMLLGDESYALRMTVQQKSLPLLLGRDKNGGARDLLAK